MVASIDNWLIELYKYKIEPAWVDDYLYRISARDTGKDPRDLMVWEINLNEFYMNLMTSILRGRDIDELTEEEHEEAIYGADLMAQDFVNTLKSLADRHGFEVYFGEETNVYFNIRIYEYHTKYGNPPLDLSAIIEDSGDYFDYLLRIAEDDIDDLEFTKEEIKSTKSVVEEKFYSLLKIVETVIEEFDIKV